MQGPTGDYGFAVDRVLSYLQGKGQVWSAAAVAAIIAVKDYIKEYYGIDVPLDKFVKDWVRLSEIEAARYETVAQKNASVVAELAAQVNYVEEQGTRTRYLPFGRKKKE